MALVGVAVATTAGCVSPTVPTCAEKMLMLTRSEGAPTGTSPATPTATATPLATPAPRGIDPAAIAAEIRRSPAVSAIVFDRAAGQYLLAEQPDRHVQAASLVKLLIALDVLARGPVDDHTRGRLQLMLSASDDAQASGFWVAGGGGSIVRRTGAALGLSAAPPARDDQWGYTRLSAQDVLTVYRHITDRLPAADRELILSALRAAPRIAADGADQYFGVPDGLPGQPWAVKQGWSSGQGVVAVHSTGLVGAGDRYVVVLLTEHPAGVGWPTAMRMTTDTARTLAPLLEPTPVPVR